MEKVVILFSGGVDSTTLIAMYKKNNYNIYPLFINYGQKSFQMEWEAVKKVCNFYNLKPYKISLPIPYDINSSDMLDTNEVEPKVDEAEAFVQEFIPHRNLFLLTLGAMYANKIGSTSISIGIYSGSRLRYSDCTLEFLTVAQKILQISSGNQDLIIHAPFLHMNKEQVVEIAVELNVPLEETISCNLGVNQPCGKCASCIERKRCLLKIWKSK